MEFVLDRLYGGDISVMKPLAKHRDHLCARLGGSLALLGQLIFEVRIHFSTVDWVL
jgi:hypothetical protein